MKYIIFLFSMIQLITLNAQETPTCQGGSYDLVKPYLGTWEEHELTDSGMVLIGTLVTELQLDGCAIMQRFTSPDSSFSYQSLGYLESGIWKETYVFSTGRYSIFQWMPEGDSIYTRRMGGSTQLDHIYRLKYTNEKSNSYDVIAQRSYDGGRSWEDQETTRIIRVE